MCNKATNVTRRAGKREKLTENRPGVLRCTSQSPVLQSAEDVRRKRERERDTDGPSRPEHQRGCDMCLDPWFHACCFESSLFHLTSFFFHVFVFVPSRSQSPRLRISIYKTNCNVTQAPWRNGTAAAAAAVVTLNTKRRHE